MPAYVLTGAPGAGKTAVLRMLETLGYAVVEEAATDVIALENALGCAEPWRDAGFADKIVALQRQRRISFEDSLAFEQLHEQVYRDLGFRLVDVPAGPLAARVALVRQAVGAHGIKHK
jgi:predicted ATPase